MSDKGPSGIRKTSALIVYHLTSEIRTASLHSKYDPNVSFIQRFHYTTRDSRSDTNVSFIQRFYCTTKDSRANVRFHCTTRDSRPDPNVSFIQRFHFTTRDSRPDPNVRFHCTTRDSRVGPIFRGPTIFKISQYKKFF